MPAALRVIQADITTLAVDAIVNAANSSLLGGCKVGEAKVTKGCRLPAKFVIHTVGPVWRGGTNGEPELLASCYRNALLAAAARGARSIAFPGISTGIYGYPVELAAGVAVDAVASTLQEVESIQDVVFCCFSAADLAVYQSLIRSMK